MARSPSPLERHGERAASSANTSWRSGRWQGVFIKRAHITYSPTPRSGKWWHHLVADLGERQLVAAWTHTQKRAQVLEGPISPRCLREENLSRNNKQQLHGSKNFANCWKGWKGPASMAAGRDGWGPHLWLRTRASSFRELTSPTHRLRGAASGGITSSPTWKGGNWWQHGLTPQSERSRPS